MAKLYLFSVFAIFLTMVGSELIPMYNFLNNNEESVSKNGLWPGSVIPYKIEGDLEEWQVMQSLDDFENKTCLQWFPRMENVKAYVKLIRDDSVDEATSARCYSGGVVESRFSTRRNSTAITHQLNHALCLGHEEDREDRDEYVNFRGCPASQKESGLNGGHLYDYMSTMHGPCNGQNCIRTTMSGTGSMTCGSSDGKLSLLDAEKINDLYNCTGCLSYRFKFWSQINLETDKLLYVEDHEDDGLIAVCRVYIHVCRVAFNRREWSINDLNKIELFTMDRENLNWVGRGEGQFPQLAIPMGRLTHHERGQLAYLGVGQHNVNGNNMFIIGYILAEKDREFVYSFKGRVYVIENNFFVLICKEN